MIKVFTLNKNGKIELTKQELEQLLNESYWEGYRNKNYWTYTSPSITPYVITNNTATDTSNSYTIDGNNINTNSIIIKSVSDEQKLSNLVKLHERSITGEIINNNIKG